MLNLKNFKKTTESNQKNGRISLDEFKKQATQNEKMDLEKLTGGILGACHAQWFPEQGTIYKYGWG
ncbi:hypothetical protein SAMN05880574_12633 [Chryseobacterium sp. RU37D]|uniref:hypothetical protein n=1 Tax=Chryseobacterium sp. RU37D TaxID=1907397 RepID=UPI000956BDEE|nr:hypothetical protein [Chryseobacterium sp. RU37D]SIQ80880.1 hypothetical protein SAMN05880574_12633 [Chryseobacterium sp. RU37D]